MLSKPKETTVARVIHERVTIGLLNEEMEVFAAIGHSLGLDVETTIRRLAGVGAKQFLAQEGDDAGTFYPDLAAQMVRQGVRRRRKR